MDWRATSTKRNERAFSLLEMIVGFGIAGVVLLAVAQLMFYSGRSFAALMNYTELDRYSRNALDQMVKKIRMADMMTDFQTNRLTFSFQGTNTLTYTYSPGAKTLTETLGGTSKTLLTGCDYLTFTIFQRNTASGTYDQFPATMTNSTAKLVLLNWTCSRTVLGGRINSESVQSAKIVIRNQ